MPLPDTGADGPLDWAHLVDAAKAFEGRHTLFSFPPRISLEVKGNYLYYFAVKGGAEKLNCLFSPEEGTVTPYFFSL